MKVGLTHSPLPWGWRAGPSEVLGEDGIISADGGSVFVNCGREAGNPTSEDRELIIKSCNSFEDLLVACQRLLAVNEARILSPSHLAWDEFRSAVAKAEGSDSSGVRKPRKILMEGHNGK